jgi:carboxymethylenebutenolidase
MIRGQVTIGSPVGPMPAYVARPDSGVHPAVIMLEGVFGFDAEIQRMTDLVASAGYVGVAIDYFRGRSAAEGFKSADVLTDIGATRDWINDQPYADHNHVATWGFGIGGSAAFMSAALPGFSAAISFYGQSIARGLPDGADAPIRNAEQIRTPLLLLFGGRDELITQDDITRIKSRLDAAHKKYEVEIYANVGHSFFREDLDTIATREIADAWDRVQAFLSRAFD